MALAAASFTTGCVNISVRPAAPSTAPGTPQQHAREVRPRPAHESVATIGPARPAPPDEPDSQSRSPREPAPRRSAGPEPAAPAQRSDREAAEPPTEEVRHPHPAAPPHAPAGPVVPDQQPSGRTDICALGQLYGRWSPNSDAARICRQTYGH